MNLTTHFTIEEMIFSQVAVRYGIDNRATGRQKENLKALCENTLEPIRALVDAPVHVTSGLRQPAVNTLVGGSQNSQHIRGEAADIQVTKYTTEELFALIIRSGIPFDQIIQEFGSWVHITWKRNGTNRRSILRATHNKKGDVVYSRAKESDFTV